MRICVLCDETIRDTELFKITIGGILYENGATVFYPDEDNGSFEDGSVIKWLCSRCASSSNVYVDELEQDICKICNSSFIPQDAYLSESVIRIEWGCIVENTSNRGPPTLFVADVGANAHFACACDDWGIPLWNLGHVDC